MPQYYVRTSLLYPNPVAVQHVTYMITGPAAQTGPAPGVPSTDSTTTTQTAQLAEPVNLDAMIAKRREKARRMRQR